MKFPLAACMPLLFPLLAGAAPLDDAVALVRASHPAIVAQRDAAAEEARQQSWTSDLTLSWTENGTDYGGAGGANAAVRVRFPLFDRSRELKAAQARVLLAQTTDAVIKFFLADVERVGTKAVQVRELERMRAFQRDRLAYRRREVEDRKITADELWLDAERAQVAEQDYRRATGELDAMREAVARQYGGDAWTTLLGLLVEHSSPTGQ